MHSGQKGQTCELKYIFEVEVAEEVNTWGVGLIGQRTPAHSSLTPSAMYI